MRIGGMTLTRASLTDTTHCPVCGALLPGPRCTACGADLSGPDGVRLHRLSQQIAGLLDERDTVISRIRAGSHDQQPAPVPAAPLPLPSYLPSYLPADRAPLARPSLFSRLGVHGVLLGIGALLLAVASIVFLVYSWRLMNLPLRATIIASLTAAVLLIAGRMRPRLPDAGEAIGWLGVVLVLADAWAVRNTGLWGADEVSALAYAAGAAVICALLLAAWSAVFEVRAGSISAAVLGPLALVLAGAEIDPAALGGQGLVLGLIAGSALGLVRAALPRKLDIERQILLVISAGLLAAGTAATLTSGPQENAYPWSAAMLAVAGLLAGLHAGGDGVVARRRAWSLASGALLALAAAQAGQAVARSSVQGRFSWVDAPWTSSAALSPWALVPMLLGAIVAVLTCVPAVRHVLSRSTAVRPGYLLTGAAAIAGALAVPAIVHAVAGIGETLAIASPAWQVRATTALANASTGTAISSERGWLTAIAGASLLAVWTAALDRLGAPAELRRWLRLVAIGSAGVTAVLFTMAPWLPLWATVVVLLLVGLVATFAMRDVRAWPVSAVAITIAAVLSWASQDLSPAVTMIAAIALLLARRRLPSQPGLRAALALAGTTAALIAGQAGLVRTGLADHQALLILALIGAALVAALIGSPRGPLPARPGRARWSGADRLAAATPAFLVLLAGCAYWGFAQWAHSGAGQAWPVVADLPDAGSRAPVLSAALLAVLALSAVRPVSEVASSRPALRVAASGAIVPVAGLSAVQIVELTDAGIAACLVTAGVVALAGVVIAVLSLARTLPGARRLSAEIGTVLTGLTSLSLVGDATDDLNARLWVVLLLLGAGATAVSTAPDRSRVRWLAGLLLTGSSWTRLAASGVTVVEAYTLPPAAVLLALSLLQIRRTPSSAPRLLTQVAAVALGPSILVAVSGSAWRPALLLVSAGLLAAAAVALDRRGAGAVSRAVARIAMVTAAALALIRALGNLSRLDQAGAHHVPLSSLEAWTVPAGLLMLIIGLTIGWVFSRAQQGKLASSWYQTGPGLAFVLGPGLLLLLGQGASDAGPARMALLTGLAGSTLFLGAVQRLQAPVLMGAAVLIVDGLTYLLPWVAQAGLPPWVILAVIGLSLMILGATYERRLRELRDLRLLIAALN
jgi:hypothetical protein